MYYILRPIFRDATVSIDKMSHGEYSITLGEKMPPDFPEPMLFEIDTTIGAGLMPTIFLPDTVFSLEFIDALRSAGVDNFDTYKVLITNPDTGEKFENYRAVNIIGRVSCTDLSASNYDELAGSCVMRRLVIKPERARGAYMFRLHEDAIQILVSDHVVQHLPLARFPDVAFIPVDESPS